MSNHFRAICEQVCQEQGWELQGNGVHVPLPEGRSQVVEIETFEYEDEDLVRLTTVIGSAESLSEVRTRAAMELNARLPHGAFGVRSGELVMTETLLLQDTDAAELEASLRYLAITADRYEEQLFETDQH
ncbi:MAG: YbjN domain-containing protein [Myxococcota bacterium]